MRNMVWNAVNTAPELTFCGQSIPLLLPLELSKPQVSSVFASARVSLSAYCC